MKIFAIIPVYNVEPYVTEFLSSLHAQDCDNITYVIINDGSTDKSGNICNAYAEKDCRFVLINQQNAGVSAARNAGLDYVGRLSSPDDYILFFDPDDYLTSDDAINRINKILAASKPDILIYNHNINNSLISNAIQQESTVKGDSIGSLLYPAVLFGKKIGSTSLTASLFRSAFSAEIIKKNHLRFRTDIRKAEDTLFYARCLSYVDYAMLSPIAPYNYRVRSLSLTTTYRQPTILGIEKGLSILTEFKELSYTCPGISPTAIENYFRHRYTGLVLNHVINLTDSRCTLTRSEIRAAVKDLYAVNGLKRKTSDIPLFAGDSMLQRLQNFIVKTQFGLIAYGRIFNKLKIIKNKIR